MARKKEKKILWKNCDDCRHIVADDGHILKSYWKINGKKYEIIGTESTGRKVLDAVDSIMETDNKGNVKVYRIERKKLYLKTRKEIINFEK